MARFFIRDRGEPERGPLHYGEVLRLIEVGGITRSTELRGEGRSSWHKAGDVAGLADALQAAEARLPRYEPVESTPPLAPPRPPAAPTPPPPFPVEVTPPPERPLPLPTGRIDPDVEWSAPEAPMATDSTSGPPVDVSPPQPRLRAAKPVPVGLGDRILRVAFGFGKGFSVFAVLVAILAVVGSVGLGLYALMPNPLPTSMGVTDPEVSEFIAACERPTPSQGRRGADPAAGSGSGRTGRAGAIDPFDPCREYRTRFTKVVAILGLEPERSTEVICSNLGDVPSQYQEQFVSGLEGFAQAWAREKPSGEDCDAASATNWYVREFDQRIEAESLAQLAREQADAVRRALLLPAAAGVGGSLLFILLFLAFPLLIQIERNTRTE